MYECLKCMIDWQFDREVSQRQTKHWKIGHVVARAATYSQGKTSLERPSLRDVSKPWLRAIKLVKEDPWKVLGYRSPLLGVSVLGKHWMFASVVNAFSIFHSFIFHFQTPFLPEPPFRVFDSPGNKILFIAPFLPELPS